MFFKNKELIAENKRLEKELEAFHTVRDELREEMLYVELSSDGRIRAINKLFSQATGYSINALEGKAMNSLVSQTALNKPATQEWLGAIKSHRHWHGAVSFLDANEKEMWVRGIVQPVDDESGRLSYIAFYMAEQTQNITQSNEMRDMLAALNRSSAVIEFKLDGTIIKANDNFLKGTGYTLEQIVGKHHRIFCSSDYANSEDYKQFWQSLAKGELASGRYKRIDSRGNDIWLEASYNPIRNENGELYKVVKFATVITEQMQREFAISEAANVAFNISQETGEQARKGNAVLDSTVNAMNELTVQMGNASNGIRDLDEQSQKVADLVKSISGIADQTNLLALNAAIEAARAGDQGRGFAVVADEVRQLASRTSSATEEIVNVVVENRKLTENAVQLIEAGQQKAREALEYSTQSGDAMRDIQSGANEVVNAIGQFTKRL